MNKLSLCLLFMVVGYGCSHLPKPVCKGTIFQEIGHCYNDLQNTVFITDSMYCLSNGNIGFRYNFRFWVADADSMGVLNQYIDTHRGYLLWNPAKSAFFFAHKPAPIEEEMTLFFPFEKITTPESRIISYPHLVPEESPVSVNFDPTLPSGNPKNYSLLRGRRYLDPQQGEAQEFIFKNYRINRMRMNDLLFVVSKKKGVMGVAAGDFDKDKYIFRTFRGELFFHKRDMNKVTFTNEETLLPPYE